MTYLIWVLTVKSSKDLLLRDIRIPMLVSAEDFRPLLSKLKRLFEYCVTDETLLKAFKAWHKKVEKLNTRRNEYIHSPLWDLGDYGGFSYRQKLERAPTGLELMPRQKVTTSELDECTTSIINARDEISDLVMLNIDDIRQQHKSKIEALIKAEKMSQAKSNLKKPN